ncbi:MAG: phage protein Gp27 family protein [Spirulina sp.]
MQLSKIYTEFTEEEREILDEKLIQRRFSKLDDLLEELQEEGFDMSRFSRASLGRYSRKLKEKTERIRHSQEYSKAIVEAIPDDEDCQSEARLALTKQTLFDLFLELNLNAEKLEGEDGQKLIKSVASLSRAASEIARSSISLKKYKKQVKERCKEAAKEVGSALKESGISPEKEQFIKRKFLGIVDG